VPAGQLSKARSYPSRKESGVLRTKIQEGTRPGAAVLLCGALLIVPLLLIQNGSGASASKAGSGRVRPATTAPSHGGGPSWRLASDTKSRSTADTSGAAAQATALPMTTSVSTTVPAPQAAAPHVQEAAQRVLPTTTTTPVTAPPTTTSTPATVAAGGSAHYGQLPYYAHPAGRCASPFLPFGTAVRITNPANGASAICVVDDREADTQRSIDLATSTFAALAPLWQGVIDAQLSW
jgi:cytoskeletal protein RodZ